MLPMIVENDGAKKMMEESMDDQKPQSQALKVLQSVKDISTSLRLIIALNLSCGKCVFSKEPRDFCET